MQLVKKQIQLIHPEKMLEYLPAVDDSSVAGLFGLSRETYQQIKREFEEQAVKAALDLIVRACMLLKVD